MLAIEPACQPSAIHPSSCCVRDSRPRSPFFTAFSASAIVAAQVELPASVDAYASAMDDLLDSRWKVTDRASVRSRDGGCAANPGITARTEPESQYQQVQRRMRGSLWCGKPGDSRAPRRRLLQEPRAQAGHQGRPRVLRDLPAHGTRRQRSLRGVYPSGKRSGGMHAV